MKKGQNTQKLFSLSYKQDLFQHNLAARIFLYLTICVCMTSSLSNLKDYNDAIKNTLSVLYLCRSTQYELQYAFK